MKRILAFFLILILCGCKDTYPQPSGNISDMSGYHNLSSEQFYDISVEEIFMKIDNKDTMIIYCGYDNCNWCNCLVPVLNEISINKDMKLYYMDFHKDINQENVDGIKKLGEVCKEYIEYDENETKFPFPSILYFKKGELIEFHSGTVSGHDANEHDLTEKQTERLRYLLNKEFDMMLK